MIKAEFNVCSSYNSCFIQGTTLVESVCGSQCLKCDLYRAYSLGLSEGAKQAVQAVNNIINTKSLLGQPFGREAEE